jgi:hypothetical protein
MADSFDGIIPQIFAGGGQVNNINGTFSTTNPGVEFQTVFAAGYAAVKADYDEIWMNGSGRKQLSDAIKAGAPNTAYRINLSQDEVGGYIGGAVVGSIVNEITGKNVPFQVTPLAESRALLCLSATPSHSQTRRLAKLGLGLAHRDYLRPELAYNPAELSTTRAYVRGTLVGYAPTYNALVTGIKAASSNSVKGELTSVGSPFTLSKGMLWQEFSALAVSRVSMFLLLAVKLDLMMLTNRAS